MIRSSMARISKSLILSIPRVETSRAFSSTGTGLTSEVSCACKSFLLMRFQEDCVNLMSLIPGTPGSRVALIFSSNVNLLADS